MFNFLKSWLRTKNTGKSPLTYKKSSISLEVEKLEDRALMSFQGAVGSTLASAVNLNTGVTEYFAKDTAGHVREFDSTGAFHFVDSDVKSMSAGHDNLGNVVLYQIKMNNDLQRVNANWTITPLDKNVAQVASSFQNSTYWEVKNDLPNGQSTVYEHRTFKDPYGVKIESGAIVSIASGKDSNNQDEVYIIFGPNNLERHVVGVTNNIYIGYGFTSVQGGVHGKWYGMNNVFGFAEGDGNGFFTTSVSGQAIESFTTGLDMNGNSICYVNTYGNKLYRQNGSGWTDLGMISPTNIVGGGNNGFCAIYGGGLYTFDQAGGHLRDGGY